MSTYFLSCDWGTSSFRLRLVEIASCKIIQEVSSSQGIAATYQAYVQHMAAGHVSNEVRLQFYLQYLAGQLELLEQKVDFSLSDMPVLLSGMASSTIGMMELPYASLPFSLTGSDAITQWIPATDEFHHPVLLISGLASNKDVMRGEETQIIGLLTSKVVEEAVCILPGTHSKHIYVNQKYITDFRTYMTGELFNVIASHTILQASVEKKHLEEHNSQTMEAFRQGVKASVELNNILHALFTVRTGELFKQRSKQLNYYYLSGLLIGKELEDLTRHTQMNICICSSSNLVTYYQAAIEVLGLSGRTSIVPAGLIDNIVISGQLQIWKQATKHPA